MLDSCHSAAFITRVLDAALEQYADLVVPFHLFASCMEDEFAWEESGLGHGIFTYSFSVQASSIGSLSAVAVQPDNSIGPSLAIAGGDFGCSLLTAGAQNPVVYWNGTGHLEICGQSMDLFEGGKYVGLDEMRACLRRERDRVTQVIRPMTPNRRVEGRQSDEEMRTDIRKEIEFVTNRVL